MEALLDHNQMSCLRVIQPGTHGPAPPFVGRAAFGITLGLVYAGWVIYNHDVGTLTGPRAYRGDHSISGRTVLKTGFLVLVITQAKPISPPLLVPRALDQGAALEGVANRQLRPIRTENPADSRMTDPYPSRPEDGD
jgi:hypothetical protein